MGMDQVRGETPVARSNGEVHRASHLVQFYETDAYLVDGVARFIAAGLSQGQGALVIASQPHRDLLEKTLRKSLRLESPADGRYVIADAGETLASVMVGGWPDEERFREVVGGAITRVAAASPRRHVRAFGEMVALLWADGRRDAALRLEELWNDLAAHQPFSLLCGYPIRGFGALEDTKPFQSVVRAHSDVLPSESYGLNVDEDHRRRLIVELQQKATVLETEVAMRRRLEDELKAKVEELAEVDRRKDEFLAMLGHELRNPLSPVATALHLMRLHGEDPIRMARAREIVERQVEHMTRLIDDLLDVSRITRGQIDLREEVVALAEVIERAVEIAKPLIDERGHRLALELPEQPILLVADSARLEQALANLLNNAAKYTEVGGHIAVRARFDGAGALISVRDDGDGIAPDTRDRIFDLFVQGPDARRRARGGLGIGLTLVRRIVELHGGTIQVFSDGRGKGSEFVIRLPLRSGYGEQNASGSDGGLAPAGHRRRVLVVDDNLDAAESLAELLRDGGHNVRTAQDGPTALREAGGFRPDVVILDLGLPEVDGFEVARRLREDSRLAETVIVALTGYGEARHRRRTDEAGFDHHFTKPVDVDELELVLAGLKRSGRRPRPN
jgi:signal transduction histidine kinase/ActR/RegA family two-component response regulator